MSTKGKRFLSVPVLAVFSLMCFVYYSSIFVFLHDWLNLQSSPATLNAYLFSLFAFLSLFSFFSCVFTDPGHVPSSYAPDVEFSKDVSFSRIYTMGMCWMNPGNALRLHLLLRNTIYVFKPVASLCPLRELSRNLNWISLNFGLFVNCQWSMLQVHQISCCLWLLNSLLCLTYGFLILCISSCGRSQLSSNMTKIMYILWMNFWAWVRSKFEFYNFYDWIGLD